MATREDYRRYAEKCLDLARVVTDPRDRAALVHMAQVWLRLAGEEVEPSPRQMAD